MLQLCHACCKCALLRLPTHLVRCNNITAAMQENKLKDTCEQDGCYKRASFGYLRGKAERCGTHRLESMVGMPQPCHESSALLCSNTMMDVACEIDDHEMICRSL